MEIPQPHRDFLDRALPLLAAGESVVGIAAAGSYVAPGLDEHSDLDLVIVTSDLALCTDRVRQMEIARTLGDLIECFTGEHVGEPRLLICLYGDPLLHVDIKWTTLEGFKERVDDPAVLHDPTGALAKAIRENPGLYPEPDLQWVENRIWVWMHYSATKLRRGELLAAKQSAQYMLERIIGPLLLLRAGAQPCQLRRMETVAPSELPELYTITGASSRAAIKVALESLAEIYIGLRDELGKDVRVNERAESECRRFVVES